MAFLKRLGWYLVGLSLGIVFLVFFLKKKSGEDGIDFCYLPNCRVLKNIRSKPLLLLPNEKDTLRFETLDEELQWLLKEGDIDFGASETDTEPCKTYVVEHDDKALTLRVKNCADHAVIETVSN